MNVGELIAILEKLDGRAPVYIRRGEEFGEREILAVSCDGHAIIISGDESSWEE